VPAGADCVVMVEHVSAQVGGGLAEAREIVPGKTSCQRSGGAGREVVVAAGQRMGVTEMQPRLQRRRGAAGLRQPRAAILATGDELVEVAETPLEYQFVTRTVTHWRRSENGWSEPEILRIVRDDKARRTGDREAESCDLVLLTAEFRWEVRFCGAGAGGFGSGFLLYGARIQPGKPVVFGKLANSYFFGLPGNPCRPW